LKNSPTASKGMRMQIQIHQPCRVFSNTGECLFTFPYLNRLKFSGNYFNHLL
jgi:hypothetical protein